MESHGGKVGFRIPEYQRTYDWDESNLKRLLEDSLNGFYYLSQHSNQESYTFLGTMILVDDKQSEPSFDGTSLEIVDGQQRITTLSLLCCALLQQIFSNRTDIDSLDLITRTWINQEIATLTEALIQCTSGNLTQRGITTAFPRVARARDDNRANTTRDSQYSSAIAQFLWEFSQYVEDYHKNADPRFEPRQHSDRSVIDNYRYLKRQIETTIYRADGDVEARSDDNRDITCETVPRAHFERSGLRSLFQKLSALDDQSTQHRAVSALTNNAKTEGFVRLMLFSWYVLKCVVLTRVETDDEKYGFDIFDALNTTGQPLTALETLKPLVIQWERQRGRYDGSFSEQQFGRLAKDLHELYPETNVRQRETKDLVVSFALYYAGRRLGLELGAQRTFLRSEFQRARNGEAGSAKRYIESIADVAEYRRHYWKIAGIRGLDAIHSGYGERIDSLKLCLAFISDMNTSLAIPILARYWTQYRGDGDEERFLKATRSVTAFLAIRRAVTGGTGGIDSDFRSIMQKIHVTSKEPLLNSEDLNEELRRVLAKERIGVRDRETWVAKAREVPMGMFSNHLCRFLLFAAADGAHLDAQKSGLLSREGVIPAPERYFLNFPTWHQGQYATVEHVAPADPSQGGVWDARIYERPNTRHTIGNLVLLPQKENSSVGNAPWVKKKIFYAALRATTRDERATLIEQAEQEGFEFTLKTKGLLNRQARLNMLDALTSVEEWTETFIRERSRNMLELAWDRISPWLYA